MFIGSSCVVLPLFLCFPPCCYDGAISCKILSLGTRPIGNSTLFLFELSDNENLRWNLFTCAILHESVSPSQRWAAPLSLFMHKFICAHKSLYLHACTLKKILMLILLMYVLSAVCRSVFLARCPFWKFFLCAMEHLVYVPLIRIGVCVCKLVTHILFSF